MTGDDQIQANDGLQSLIGGLGDPSRDKAASVAYLHTITSPEQLSAMYRTSWLAKKIVEIPAMDGVRKWRDWQAESADISKIEAEEARLNIRGKVYDARVRARLFGGAAMFIGTGETELTTELDPESVTLGGVKYINVLSQHQVTAGTKITDPSSEWFGQPENYTVQSQTGQVKIHPSRMVIFTGTALPDYDVAGNVWGESVLVAALDAIKNADSTAANVASLVFEAKIDVIRVPNFMSSLGQADYQSRLLTRFRTAMAGKGINGTLLLDMEEEYQQKSASFSALPDVIDRFLQMVAGAADIPLTRLLGTSPSGMNSTGEHDMKNYHDRVHAEQELFITPAMHRLDEALIRSALGSRDDDIHYAWSPLEQMSEKEVAEIGDLIASIVEKMANTGLFLPEALANAAANAFVENSIFPGLEQMITDAGGLPDFEAEAKAEEERLAAEAKLKAQSGTVTRMQRAANDADPRTLYVRRDVVNRAEIVSWAKKQGFTDVVPDLHVTIAYSTTPVDWFKVGTSWSEKMDIAAGGPRQMDRLGPEGKYIALLITASELVWRNREIREAGASWDWPDYQPHISIQIGGDIDLDKVEPYQGKIVLGPEIFEEVRTD